VIPSELRNKLRHQLISPFGAAAAAYLLQTSFSNVFSLSTGSSPDDSQSAQYAMNVITFMYANELKETEKVEETRGFDHLTKFITYYMFPCYPVRSKHV